MPPPPGSPGKPHGPNFPLDQNTGRGGYQGFNAGPPHDSNSEGCRGTCVTSAILLSICIPIGGLVIILCIVFWKKISNWMCSCDEQLEGPQRFKSTAEANTIPTATNSTSTGIQTLPAKRGECYPMRRKGFCFLFNNYNFLDADKRLGSQHDVNRLIQVFAAMGFTTLAFVDQTADEMKRTIGNYATLDHSNYDCLLCFVMSHGEEGVVFGVDNKQVLIKEDIVRPFANCESLHGKPKLIFVQACRGGKEMWADRWFLDAAPPLRGVYNTLRDSFRRRRRRPAYADILIAYSTVDGFVSYRSAETGSFWIQIMCNVLEEQAHCEDLLSMMTEVNRRVLVQFASCDNKLSMVPDVNHTLGYKIYLLD